MLDIQIAYKKLNIKYWIIWFFQILSSDGMSSEQSTYFSEILNYIIKVINHISHLVGQSHQSSKYRLTDVLWDIIAREN